MSYITMQLEKLNELLEAQGKKRLKAWKRSTKELEFRLKAERSLIEAAQKQVDDLVQEEVQPEPTPVETNTDRKSKISDVCRAGISANQSNDEIHAELWRQHNEGLLKTQYADTKKWYITWYRSDVKRKAAKAALETSV